MVPDVDTYSIDVNPDQRAQALKSDRAYEQQNVVAESVNEQQNTVTDRAYEQENGVTGTPDTRDSGRYFMDPNDQPADSERYFMNEEQNTAAYPDGEAGNVGGEWNDQEPELLLFTTMYKSEEKVGVLEKLFNLWASWIPAIKPLVFTSDPAIEQDANSYNWPYLPEKKDPDCFGPPLFPNMFIDAMANYDSTFYCYANSDIIFDKGLLDTIRFFEKNETLMRQPFVAVGKRIYFDFEKYGHLMQTADDVSELANTGEEIHWSSDYWVTTKQFPWEEVLPISVGRPLFCRWIIAYAIERKLTVIDTSKTIKAVHLTTQDGNRSSWDKPGNDCNARIIMYGQPQVKQMRLGLVECADLETYYDANGEIKLRSRLPDAKECPAYYNPNLPNVWYKPWGLTPP